jgi:hypothetical protein
LPRQFGSIFQGIGPFPATNTLKRTREFPDTDLAGHSESEIPANAIESRANSDTEENGKEVRGSGLGQPLLESLAQQPPRCGNGNLRDDTGTGSGVE